MRQTRTRIYISLCVFMMKPLLVVLLLFGVFGIVYLRSSFLKLEYSLSELETEKMECLKERKMLLAQKTSLQSFERLEASLNTNQGFVLPDRVKVIHINKERKYLPHKVSLERE